MPSVEQVAVAGSFRRMRETVGDLDIVVVAAAGSAVMKKFCSYDEVREVLLRLQSREGEVIPPSAFIPAAERYNQMQAIDRWVIRSVFSGLGNAHEVPPVARIAINLSGQSLGDRQFLEFVEQEVASWGVPLERVCFEITETANPTTVARLLTASTILILRARHERIRHNSPRREY